MSRNRAWGWITVNLVSVIYRDPQPSPYSLIRKFPGKAGYRILLILAGFWAGNGLAAQQSSLFAVSITLRNPQAVQTGGLCRSSARIGVFGQTVVIVCATGEPIEYTGDTNLLPWSSQNDTLRYIALTPTIDEPTGNGRYSGLGTVSSWRKIRLANRDYLELMIRW